MIEFEVIDMMEDRGSFTVEVELKENRKRRKFGFPLNEGWETILNGVPKYVTHILSLLEKEQNTMTNKEFEAFKKTVVGKTFGGD